MAQKSPVADLAALKALIYHDDDDLIFVTSSSDRYRYESSSVVADDGHEQIRPTNFDAAGVWIKVGSDPAEAGSGFKKATILSAEVLALNATPITLVPAPGAGKALVFEGTSIHKPAGVAYAGVAAGEDLGIKYTGSGGLEVGACEMTGFADSVAAMTRWILPRTGVLAAGTISSISPVEDAPLVAHMLVGEIITGDSDFIFNVRYRVIDMVPL